MSPPSSGSKNKPSKKPAALQGVIFQKMDLFITTAVRTSNHTAEKIFMILYDKEEVLGRTNCLLSPITLITV
jgi:hypothetical protein